MTKATKALDEARAHLAGTDEAETIARELDASDGVALGDGGAREEQVIASIGAMENAAADAVSAMDMKSLVVDLRDAMLEQFRNRPKPWNQLSNPEQRDCAAALEFAAEAFSRKATALIAADSRPSVRCRLDGYAEKDGIKISLSLGAMPMEEQERAIVQLHRANKKTVVIITADADAYKGSRTADLQPDQSEMPFEAGSDGLDTDLAD